MSPERRLVNSTATTATTGRQRRAGAVRKQKNPPPLPPKPRRQPEEEVSYALVATRGGTTTCLPQRTILLLLTLTCTLLAAATALARVFPTTSSSRAAMAPWRSFLSTSRSSSTSATKAAAASAAVTTTTDSLDEAVVNRRLRTALWGLFAGDALAAPTHWYYGGWPQIQSDYGPHGIVDYTQPVTELRGSILNKSNLNGGGRATTARSQKNKSNAPKTIVGDVILHGKQDLWAPTRQIHYHATLQAGENTLEASLVRVLVRTLTATHGTWDANRFRQAYMDFMMTPGSHNDTYASTCHRMFFANLVHRGMDPVDCPDDDHHNVLTIDGLVLPTVVAIVTAARTRDTQAAGQAAAASVAVTRRSAPLQEAAHHWGVFCARSLLRPPSRNGNPSTWLPTYVQQLAREAGLPQSPRPRNALTACYLSSAWPALLDNLLLFHSSPSPPPSSSSSSSPLWQALLTNANTGGENVHRGACLGAVLGLYQDDFDESSSSISYQAPLWTQGLYHRAELQAEMDALLHAIGQRE